MSAVQFRKSWNREPRWFLEPLIAFWTCLCCVGVGIVISAAWTHQGVAIFGAAYTLLNGEALVGAIVAERRERGKSSV
jgi:hypothetical protein